MSTKTSIPPNYRMTQVIDDVRAKHEHATYYDECKTPYRMAQAADEYYPLGERYKRRERALLDVAQVTFQGELLKVRCHTAALVISQGGKREAITMFSPKARKNMLEMVSKINWQNVRATFITLTYHEIIEDAFVCKNHLRTFLKRLYRRFGDKAVLWRLEPQKRGAWHFHVIVWDLPYFERDTILEWWREITEQPTITQVDVRLIRSAKKARSYVAKYVGKKDVVPYFNYMTNLPVGRFWGIENRVLVQWAQLITYSVMLKQGFFEFKTAARSHWNKIGYGRRVGFALFVQNAVEWEVLLSQLVTIGDMWLWDDKLKYETS